MGNLSYRASLLVIRYRYLKYDPSILYILSSFCRGWSSHFSFRVLHVPHFVTFFQSGYKRPERWVATHKFTQHWRYYLPVDPHP